MINEDDMAQILLGCLPEALVTLVRLLVGVSSDVPHQITRFLKLLRTVLTLMPADTTNLQYEVEYKSSNDSHTSAFYSVIFAHYFIAVAT